MFGDVRQREFLLSVALPAMLIALATAAVVFLALDRMANEFNGFDHLQETNIVKAVVAEEIARTEKRLTDLVDEVTAPRNRDGSPTEAMSTELKRQGHMDPGSIAILTDENGQPLSAYAAVGPDPTWPIVIDKDDFLTLRHRLLGKPSMLEAGIVSSTASANFAAIARMPKATRDAPQRFLLLLRPFEQHTLAATASDFGISQLVWRVRMVSGEGTELSSVSGRPIGMLVWKPRGSGFRAYNDVAGPMLVVLALLYVGMGFLVLTNWTLVKTMRKGEAEAKRDAKHDALSGLPNRAHFHTTLNELASSWPTPVITVMFVDLDGFKEVNDTHGHEVGDRLIKAVAAGFSCLIAGRATLARLGGDEFAVVLKGYQSFAESVELGGRMIAFLDEPFLFEGRSVRVGASIGIASSDEEVLTSVELVRRADVAMYAAKARGKNRVEIYSPELDAGRTEKIELASALRKAVENNELQIHYQPVIDAETGRIAMAEALIRWIRPDVGPIRPAVFLPIAEEAGLTELLGSWILHRVCQDARGFGNRRVAVNVFASQFKNPLFDEQLKAILEEENFPADNLELDINESYLVAYPDRAQRMITALHRLGVHVALDDFGTGFSSISYLRRFAFDKVKIDRSVVIDVARDPASQQLVRSTVALADTLGVNVTAEGIERADEADTLTAAGCRELQGYYFGAPTMPDELVRRLKRESMTPIVRRHIA